MENKNYIKTLGVFVMGWALSGFGLTHMLETEPVTNTVAAQKANVGIPLKLTLSLVNASDNVASASGIRVDMIQCSKNQPYNRNSYNCQPLSQEGKNTIGNPMRKQSQFTDENGQVSFNAAYPDKYTSPTTHFHIMVYDRYNNLITSSQFDFPDVVYPTPSAFYAAGGKNPTAILLNDPTANPPLLVTGNATAGFVATRSIFIPEDTSGISLHEAGETTQVSNLKNFPNPVTNGTTFAFQLTQASEVEITVTDNTGVNVKTLFTDNLQAGPHEIEVDLGGLQKGVYFYKLQVSNNSGTFSEAKKLIKA